jgi:hypothetical protein
VLRDTPNESLDLALKEWRRTNDWDPVARALSFSV